MKRILLIVALAGLHCAIVGCSREEEAQPESVAAGLGPQDYIDIRHLIDTYPAMLDTQFRPGLGDR